MSNIEIGLIVGTFLVAAYCFMGLRSLVGIAAIVFGLFLINKHYPVKHVFETIKSATTKTASDLIDK